MLRNKTPAPEFTLFDHNGRESSLHALHRDKPLVLLFFRGAFCPTSRRDLLSYADVYARIRKLDANFVALSVDGPEALQKLRERLELPFRLLCDADFAVSRTYGVYESDETDEGPQPHGEPAVFIVDADRNIAYSQLQSGPKGGADPAELILILLYMEGNNGRYW